LEKGQSKRERESKRERADNASTLINSKARTFDLGKSPIGYENTDTLVKGEGLYYYIMALAALEPEGKKRNLHNICRNIFRTQIAQQS